MEDVLERDRQWYSDDFKSSMMLALALHLFLIMIAFIAGRVLGVISDDKGAMEVLSASVRVDVVGMPKLTIEELRQMEMPAQAPQEKPEQAQASKTEAKQEAPKPDDLVIPDNKKPKKSLSSFLSDYSQQKVKVDSKSKKGEAKGKVDGLDSLIVEGNRLSKGTALVGNTSDMEDSVFVGYVQTLPERVRSNWRLPQFLKDQNLKCKIHIWIGPRGELIKVSVRESSGNSDYDSLAEDAVRASAPFVPPPVDAAPKLGARGIVLGFPLL